MTNYKSIPIQLAAGTKIRFEYSSPEQVKWGNNDDPDKYLQRGAIYTVALLEVHTQHTKVYLQEFPDKKFNSVSFSLV